MPSWHGFREEEIEAELDDRAANLGLVEWTRRNAPLDCPQSASSTVVPPAAPRGCLNHLWAKV
jgi:hypothetical protein